MPAPPPGAPARDHRSGEFPPPPGSSPDLPPGYVSGEAKAKRRKRDRRKHGLMVVLGIVLVLGALLVGLILSQGGDDPTTLADVEVGDCFNGEPNDVSTVDCAESHQGELFAVVQPPDPAAAFPGAETVQTDAEAACTLALAEYYGAGADVALTNGLQAQAFAPTEAQWNAGETSTPCVVVSSQNEQLTGSVQGTGAAGAAG